MLATHQDAERRYDELRRVALSTAEQISTGGHRFTTIDAVAINALETWPAAVDRQVTWN